MVRARRGSARWWAHEGDGVGEQDARAERADPEGGSGGGSDRRGTNGSSVSAATSPIAHVMADMPGVWRRLLAAHVADRLGRCRGCRSDGGSGERWPCSLHRIATEARRLHDQKLARAVDAD